MRSAKRAAKRVAKKTARRAAKLAMVAGSLTGTVAFAEQLSVKLEVERPTTEAQLAQVQQRIHRAARQVCAPLESQEMSRLAAYHRCIDNAVSNAMAQLDRPANPDVRFVQTAAPAAAEDVTAPAPVAVAVPEPPVVQMLAETGSVTLTGVTFRHGSARLAPAARPALDDMAVGLKEHPDMRVEIQGYTDSTGSTAYNRLLSRQRAESVKHYLLAQGVNPAQLVAHGYGKARPIDSNSTAQGRAQNRRVVAKVLANPENVDVKVAALAPTAPAFSAR